jgi:hypothetical protein
VATHRQAAAALLRLVWGRHAGTRVAQSHNFFVENDQNSVGNSPRLFLRNWVTKWRHVTIGRRLRSSAMVGARYRGPPVSGQSWVAVT